MSVTAHPQLNRPNQLIALWNAFLIGTLFHTQLGLMPLFHGLDISAGHGQMTTELAEIVPILWLMLAFFGVPLIIIVAMCFIDARRFREGHFSLTVFYSILNLAHLVADLTVQPIAWYQIALMALLFAIGLLLNVVAYQWVRELQLHSHHRLRSML